MTHELTYIAVQLNVNTNFMENDLPTGAKLPSNFR